MSDTDRDTFAEYVMDGITITAETHGAELLLVIKDGEPLGRIRSLNTKDKRYARDTKDATLATGIYDELRWTEGDHYIVVRDDAHLVDLISNVWARSRDPAVENDPSGWREIAEQAQRNADYYRGLLDEVASHLDHVELRRCDDGTLAQDPHRPKIPGMVAELAKRAR